MGTKDILGSAWVSYSIRKQMPGVSQIRDVLYDLPTPPNLRKIWNFGSLLGLCLVVQISTGIFLAIHYTPRVEGAFSSVIHIIRDVNGGWLLRACHANGASLFFIITYFHIARGVFYFSFFTRGAWVIGCIILCVLIAIAFTGYVLPWGQMSYWGATVITNLLRAVPYVGEILVQWVWGGASVGDATLKRFFILHFLSPFLLAGLAGIHIILIHRVGANNPLGVDRRGDIIPFHPYYSIKDLLGVAFTLTLFGLLLCLHPDLFLDPENFYHADPLKTPVHIQPEWYFLFAYSILRRIPNKAGGIIALAGAILVLFIIPFYPKPVFKHIQFNYVRQILFFYFIGNFIVLTYLGACPVEDPFIRIGVLATVSYFLFFLVYPFRWYFIEKVLPKVGPKI